jgi:hypothetical protein
LIFIDSQVPNLALGVPESGTWSARFFFILALTVPFYNVKLALVVQPTGTHSAKSFASLAL